VRAARRQDARGRRDVVIGAILEQRRPETGLELSIRQRESKVVVFGDRCPGLGRHRTGGPSISGSPRDLGFDSAIAIATRLD